ncbi:secretin N-terminal domain-containing protein [Aquabacterium sp. CECT 9606]|uniref:secretin N-terminal domain-containing protein n=1 Tax=Aquabacterium sp. CECT 9606 TaxID=2845822 RepID=UPI001E286AE3|nr:secretin N-terminal domain-containing protein [Aquabacterium sp. CECT 9606]CAH0351541.1 Type 3 secretion system secretin [Aquabacterium sp. CECT 9606]
MKYFLPTLACVAALLLSACANPALRDAQALSQAGQHEAALAQLQSALKLKQDDRELRIAVLKQIDTTVAYLIYQADGARAAGRLDEVEAVLKRLEAAAPEHPRTVWLRSEVDRLKRHQRLLSEAQQSFDAGAYERAEVALRAILSEDLGNTSARSMLTRVEELRANQTRQVSTVQLATAGKPITLEFREASLRTVFESLARAANVNFVFDKDVRGDAKVTLFLRNTTVDEAMRVILSTQQLGSKLLNDNTMLVFPNTSQKQRDLLDTVTRSFYLVNADPKQVQTLIRSVAKSRDVYVDDRLNLVIVRDTPEVIRLVERLVQSVDLADPEVMLEVEVMEVSSKKLTEIGITPVDKASYGALPSTINTLTSLKGLQWSTTNPLAIATLRGTSGSTNMLANPKIRARNREKAKIMLGEKLPVFTSNLVAGTGGGASTTITYLDVGLKLDIEPQVQLDNDVTIKIALEVSTVTGRVEGPAGSGSSAYQVGTRQATTTLRLKDGETQILAGLINDDETRNSAGIPGLHDLPIAGRLFGTTKDEHNKTEIVLLVTPHIVRNLPQPDTAGSAMPSGTEAQPGAARLLIKEGTAGTGAGQGSSAGSRPVVPNRFRPGASAAKAQPQPEITGPEEVMPGASFQVTVRNPTDQALQTTVLFDAQWLVGPGGAEGGVPIEVPPQGSQVLTLSAKPSRTPGEASLSLASGGGALSLRIRPAGAEAMPEAEAPAAPTPDR